LISGYQDTTLTKQDYELLRWGLADTFPSQPSETLAATLAKAHHSDALSDEQAAILRRALEHASGYEHDWKTKLSSLEHIKAYVLGMSSQGGYIEDKSDSSKQTQHVNGAPPDFRVPVTRWGKTRIKGAAEAYCLVGEHFSSRRGRRDKARKEIECECSMSEHASRLLEDVQ
jgi:hypothetical protein